MTLNVELLSQVMKHIEANPDRHDQNLWRSGTSRDFAGWTAELSGATWASADTDSEVALVNGRRELRSSLVTTPGGALQHVEDYAASVLGLHEQAAEALFDGNASIDELRRVVDCLVEFGTVHGDPTPRTRAEVTAP
ncbi:hypothetical protein A5N78_04730 [Prescottella equi]|uniref:hypothetical protein n=1 Tax=Rhodococcus hoagii TaxID=43767 RepID=UPI000A110925|nr:hypothetical protein [Prescottella equi]ORL93444.1 hypothetical protein A5N78_04730 [Prescottella equi]ORM17797.1 hypothetical protein A5N70_11305 [Prescottella equi]